MTHDPCAPGEGANPRRNTLRDNNEHGGVDSNHAVNFTVDGPDGKQKNCGANPQCLDAALAYAARGWDVFPAPPGAKKSYKSAEYSNGRNWGKTKDPDEIRRDWAKWPNANIGLPTGIENGFFVIEADTLKGHGVDGLAALAKLTAEKGALPTTLMAGSPSGSVHRYFQHPGNGIKIKNSASEIANGVDVRGDGGMVVAPPSIRADGSYRWLNDLPIAVAPPWLIELVKEQPHERNEDAEPEADSAKIAAALAVIPNDDVNWESWNRIGMATWRATAGAGFALFDGFSQKSKKYDARNTVKKWDSYFTSPPDSIGAGTIFYLANEADPWWSERYDAQVVAELKAAGAGSEADRRMSAELGIDFEEPAEEPQAEERDAEQPHETSANRADQATGRRRLLLSSAEFVNGFVPPDYLIDGMLLRKNVYALTGRTGDGKTAVALRIMAHVACGLPLAGRDVEKGRVLFFAGENPDDVCSRWIKMCEEMQLDPDALDVFFLKGNHPISNDQIRGMIEADVAVIGPVTLLVVDTSAAFYSGDDENDNVQLGAHARMLRSFVKLNGSPTVLVTCHPTKNPDMSNLLPRGGGAFTAEIDGNLVVIREHGSPLVEVTTHGKFRGPEFDPFAFKLVEGTSEKIKNSKGRLMWTVWAVPVGEKEREAMENASEAKRDQLLKVMKDRPAASIAELATAAGWTNKDGNPNKTLVHRTLLSLKGDKLVEKKGRRYVITAKGKKALDEAADRPM